MSSGQEISERKVMTLTARFVLEDLKRAKEMLEVITTNQDWRINWLSAIALARMVGDVLDKVDAKLDPALKKKSREAFEKWKQTDSQDHAIFREFIKPERDSLIHEYASMVIQSDIVPVVILGQEIEVSADLDENIYRPIIQGMYEGVDARDILELAIEWWDKELSKLEQ
jgi:hypothetical protein